MTHNQHTQPLQCHYTVSKEYINAIVTDTNEKTPHFPIYLQINDNYFKVKLENDLYLPVLFHGFKTKAQPIKHRQQNKTKHFKQNELSSETYPSVQHTGVTLNTNKTQPFIHPPQNEIYVELINTNKFSLPALDDFVPKYPEVFNYFYNEQTLLYETQQQDTAFRQLEFWKKHKNYPHSPFVNDPSGQRLITILSTFTELQYK